MVENIKTRYGNAALHLSSLIDEDLTALSTKQIQKFVRNMTIGLNECESRFSTLLGNCNSDISYHHHTYLITAAKCRLRDLKEGLRKAPEHGNRKTNESMIARRLLKPHHPLGFYDPPSNCETTSAIETSKLTLIPLPKFSGLDGTIQWDNFWAEWRMRVHQLPEKVFPVSAKYALLVDCLLEPAIISMHTLGKLPHQESYQLLI